MLYGLPLDVVVTPLANDLYQELGAACRGPVYLRGDSSFLEYSTIFNGNVITTAKAVVCPLDAEDVSKVVLFCNKHSLSLSVKAGGYGTAGWAIGGDIIIDLSKLIEVDIEVPQEDGKFTSLKDVAPANSKGKKPVGSATGNTGKRRHEEDAQLRHYDNASRRVADFLRGPDLPSLTDSLEPPPSVRRRLEPGLGASSSTPMRSDSLPALVVDSSSSASSTSALFTPSPLASSESSSPGPTGDQNVPTQDDFKPRPAFSSTASNADPFGYLDAPTNFPPPIPASTVQSFNNPHAMLNIWGSTNPNSLITDSANVLAQMHMFSQLEPPYSHVYVTFGAGMRQKEIDTYTAKNPVEVKLPSGSGGGTVPYHVPFSAHPVGSSIMLLGGFGFLSRLHGLSVDNLVEVEMVLADGRIVIVNENDHSDLWWAIRGAGPSLGIATRYKAKAFPVPVVFAGNLIYRFHKATAPSLIKHFRDCVKGAPRELYANILLTAGPAGKDSLMVVQMCYVGPREKGQEYLAAISSWDGGKCLLNEIDEKSFLHQQDSVAQVLRGKAGRQWFIRSALVSDLPDEIINETVMQFADTPLGCTWLFELAGGAIPDYEDTCIPKSQREAAFTLAALHQWEMDFDDDKCTTTAEEWVATTLEPVHVGGPFPSFLGRHEPLVRVKGCFGDNWKRLCEIKNQYDPLNLFRNSLWPLNEFGEEVDPISREPPTTQRFDD
ncbi:hypothetical protein AGABI2DRAFT_185602 [Agaricus bisporus var. bisporus H97]|uniref:hypothetical protein n=1 Tax=Agaricus bisporus var. bisporus (strain H97 / ATCC MYA-4626 / FGSC 10389) TaxID=936046 RepID=UPI00029F5857|nr:hypothetical protein AGABI2DRAFT_185602 [Agaricus bisporus var. bisporus H97]EKV47675.1 hypothetical protein AGABI2DRAFT_185602 [Agaricus bisporus var. bisporus H97]